MRNKDGSVGLFVLAFGGSALGAVTVITVALIVYLLNTAVTGAGETSRKIPPFMCKTADELKALVVERNRFQPRTEEEYRTAWLHAMNVVNHTLESPHCFIVEGGGRIGEIAGQVLVGTTAYDVREADFSSFTYNGQYARGWFRFYVLVPRLQFAL